MPRATHQPMTVARIRRIASPRRTEEQPEVGLAVCPVRHDARPSVAFAGKVHRDSDQARGEG